MMSWIPIGVQRIQLLITICGVSAQLIWTDDSRLVNQRISGTKSDSDQCPCAGAGASSKCIVYDSRYQASSITEAVFSFPDLSLSEPLFDDDDQQQSTKPFECATQTCLSCAYKLTTKLHQIGLLHGSLPSANTTGVNTSLPCPKYKFDRTAQVSFAEDNSTIDQDESVRRLRRNSHHHHSHELIGTRFNISCTPKGDIDTNQLLSLCSTCWAWRRLPDTYFPQYLNELICNWSDDDCLSGHASCIPSYRSVDVLRRNGTIWTSVSIQTGAFCDCKVHSASVLRDIVLGTNSIVDDDNNNTTRSID